MYEAQPGMAVLEYGILSQGATLLVESFFVGARILAQTYPDYIKIKKNTVFGGQYNV